MNGTTSWDSISLGFRELFRILVPGAYAFALLRYFLEEPKPSWVFATVPGVAGAIFFLGLLVYAMNVHENIWPYTKHFKQVIKKLNDAVAEAGSLDKNENYKNLYKYFLESRAPAGVRERIHYFSSFYYMLDELSFVSALGALYAAVYNIFHNTGQISNWHLIPVLLIAGFLFAYLGYRQWQAIIEQQVVLVRDLQSEFKDLAAKWKQKSSS